MGFALTKNDSTHTATMTWNPPSSDGGSAITGYKIARDGTDALGVGPWSQVVSATTRLQTFSNLVPGTSYTLSVRAINSVGSGPAASGTVTITATGTTSQETSLNATYSGWKGVSDSTANGGGYRSNATSASTAKFTFSGTAVTWISRKGPDQGKATITIDGVSKGTVDLYAASRGGFSKAFTGLVSRSHTMIVKVTGTKNPLSSGTAVAIDAFIVGSTTTQESTKTITYNTWRAVSSTAANGGQYRVSGPQTPPLVSPSPVRQSTGSQRSVQDGESAGVHRRDRQGSR